MDMEIRETEVSGTDITVTNRNREIRETGITMDITD
jgi:hypothetical protein